LNRLIFILALLLLPFPLRGACHTVTVAGSGSHTGADWNNAYAGIPATLTRGDTYYLADGSYPVYTFNTAVSGTTTAEIRKAQTYDHCTDTGWNAGTMGSAQAVFRHASPPSFEVSASYFTLNGNGQQTSPGCGVSVGATPTSEPSTPSDCGIRIDNTLCTSGSSDACDNPLHVDSGVTHFTMEYLEGVGNGINNSERGFFGFYGGGNATNAYFSGSHLFGRNAGCVYFVWTSNNWSVTESYFWLTNTDIADDCHPQYSLTESNTSNGVEANNVYRDINGSSVFSFVSPAGTNTGWTYYNNVFWFTSGGAYATSGLDDGIVGNLNGATLTGMTFVQNTAINIYGAASGFYPGIYTSSTIQNNLWYLGAATPGMGGATGTLGYNSFLGTVSCASGTANVCDASPPNPFVSWTTGNFNLASENSDWNNRFPLGSPYTTDPNGTTRTTDRGAYQSAVTPPAPPASLFIIVR